MDVSTNKNQQIKNLEGYIDVIYLVAVLLSVCCGVTILFLMFLVDRSIDKAFHIGELMLVFALIMATIFFG
jgi:hypothetical protein